MNERAPRPNPGPQARPRSALARLTTPRMLAWHALILAVCALFASAALWQLGRHGQAVARNERIVSRAEGEALPYLSVAPQLDPRADLGALSDPRYRPVVAVGRFVQAEEVLLRGRGLASQPGLHVLTPLLLSGTDAPRAILVDRGWVPYRHQEAQVPDFAPPEGTIRVEGRLMTSRPAPTGFAAALAPRDPLEGRLETIARPDLERLQQQLPWPLEPYLLEAERLDLVAEDGSVTEFARVGEPAGTLPVLPPPPEPDSGPHLGYAFQWASFLAITLIGYVLLLRRRLFVPSRRG